MDRHRIISVTFGNNVYEILATLLRAFVAYQYKHFSTIEEHFVYKSFYESSQNIIFYLYLIS